MTEFRVGDHVACPKFTGDDVMLTVDLNPDEMGFVWLTRKDGPACNFHAGRLRHWAEHCRGEIAEWQARLAGEEKYMEENKRHD